MGSPPEWVVSFQDEVWWSRLARPDLNAWAASEPMRFHQGEADKEDTAPEALACCGLLSRLSAFWGCGEGTAGLR